jgi:hypothetical protein
MSKAEKFKTMVEQRGYGSPVDISGLQEPYQHLCDRLVRSYQDFLLSLNNPKFASFPSGDIYLGITSKERVNAVAFKRNSDSDEFIAIFIGTICHCFDDFLALFASPSFLPELGAPNLEDLQDSELKDYLTRTMSSGHFQIIPKDPVRLDCAKLFAWLALKRVFLHEVGHIVFGHLEVLSSKEGATILEHANGKLSDEECNQRQLLEAHADMYTAWVLAEFWKGYFGGSSKRIPEFALHPFKYLGVITAWEFRRQDSLETPSNDMLRRSHPRPDVRFHHFWVSFSEKLAAKHYCSGDEFVNQFVAGDLAVMEIWKRLAFPALNFETEKENFGLILCEVQKLRAGIEQCEESALNRLRSARAARVRQILSRKG